MHVCLGGVPGDVSLGALREACFAKLAPYIVAYIWQREGFTLHCSNEVAPPWSGQGDQDLSRSAVNREYNRKEVFKQNVHKAIDVCCI